MQQPQLNEPIVILEDDARIGDDFTNDTLNKIKISGHKFVRLEEKIDKEKKQKYVHIDNDFSKLLDNRIGTRG